LSAQLFKLSLCLFPSAAFLGQLLLQSGLCPLRELQADAKL